MVLITDGLIERPRESIAAGLDRLADVVSRYEGDMDGLCDELLDKVGAGERSIDDVAIICVRLTKST
jgi:hypothetical protein